MSDGTTVVLADDQELVRSGFRLILESEPDIQVVGESANGAEAVQLVAALRPDVVCMDLRMPRLDGLEATRRIVASDATSRVLVLTTFDDDDALFRALEAGASGFFLKNGPPEALIEAVRTLAAGDALLSPTVTRRVIERAVRGPARSTQDDGLTAREREVCVLVAQGLSNAEIGDHLRMAETTVKTHVSHMLLKTGLRDRVQLVGWAFGHGVVGST